MNQKNLIGHVREWVLEAEQRCRPHLWETPLEHSRFLSDYCGGEVWLKLDLVQKTTSFKLRGATSKIRSLTEEELDRGVVTASTGNYAFAVAEAMRSLGRTATTYVAENITPSRLELMRAHGLQVVQYGTEAGVAEKKARAVAEDEGKVYVSPYNDEKVIGGQGTCGLEITRQLPDLDTVVVAVGGGGLIAGIGGWMKSENPAIKVIGVSPENSPVMERSMAAGCVVDIPTLKTLADTCAGGIDHDALTLPICEQVIDEFELISEPEIAQGIRCLFEQHRLVAEGSAAMGVSLLLRNPGLFAGRRTVLVVCGRNIDMKAFRQIIAVTDA